MSGGDSEVTSTKLVSQPIDFLASVGKNDSLGDIQSVVEVAKSVELPLLTFTVDVELTNT